jgi:ribosomal-protein-alanine N-acetyltransferase
MLELHSERLDLIPLSPAQLQLYLAGPIQLKQELGIPISRAIITERVQRAIRMKLNKMATVEQLRLAWYTYWLIVIRAAPFGAGLAGFKGYPDQNGEAEIGYGIDPGCHGQGYVTEAVQCLISWAFEETACLSVVARDTKKWNAASLRVLAMVGMQVYEESEDALWLRVERGYNPD